LWLPVVVAVLALMVVVEEPVALELEHLLA
jgi:hypothetical protein